jgi:tetratricopeptide (TPR) repeat protein
MADDVLYSVLSRSIRESYSGMLRDDEIMAMAALLFSGDHVPVPLNGPEIEAFSRQVYHDLCPASSFEVFSPRFAIFTSRLGRQITEARAPKLVELPRRKFGKPGFGELEGLQVPEELAGYMTGLAKTAQASGGLTRRDGEYLAALIEKMSTAPGYLRYLDREKKVREEERLYRIARHLKSAGGHEELAVGDLLARRDLLASIGILLLNISHERKNVAFLSAHMPSEASRALLYQYCTIMAVNNLIPGRPGPAEEYAKTALECAADSDEKAYVYVLLGCIAMVRGDYDEAGAFLREGARLPGLRRRLKGLIAFYTGVVLFEKDEYANAITCFETAGRQVSDALDQVTIHNNIGSCAMQMADDARAELEFRAIEKLSLNLKGAQASQCMLMISSYRSAILGSKGDSEEVIKQYRKALKSAHGREDYKTVAELLGNLGIAHARSGDLKQALQTFKACMACVERIDHWAGIRFAYWHICRTLSETDSREAAQFIEKYTAKYPELRDL